MQVARFAAAEHQHPHVEPASRLQIARVGDDLRHRAEPRRGGQVDVGRHQNRDRAEPRQRGDSDERAGPGLHQHADVRALPHADLDQAADDVVDPAVHRLVGVDPAVEQQALPWGTSRACSDMMRPSEIRVWSLIWPRRASLGSVRYVSMASVRADLLAATMRVGGGPRQAERHLGRGGGGRAPRAM